MEERKEGGVLLQHLERSLSLKEIRRQSEKNEIGSSRPELDVHQSKIKDAKDGLEEEKGKKEKEEAKSKKQKKEREKTEKEKKRREKRKKKKEKRTLLEGFQGLIFTNHGCQCFGRIC